MASFPVSPSNLYFSCFVSQFPSCLVLTGPLLPPLASTQSSKSHVGPTARCHSSHCFQASLVSWLVFVCGNLKFDWWPGRCLSCLHAGVYRDEAKHGLTVGYHLTCLAWISRVDTLCLENNNEAGGRQTSS